MYTWTRKGRSLVVTPEAHIKRTNRAFKRTNGVRMTGGREMKTYMTAKFLILSAVWYSVSSIFIHAWQFGWEHKGAHRGSGVESQNQNRVLSVLYNGPLDMRMRASRKRSPQGVLLTGSQSCPKRIATTRSSSDRIAWSTA